jgi:preprotein translocase subunit SecD
MVRGGEIMKMTFRIWVLVICILLSLTSIFVTVNPVGISFLQKGVKVKSVEQNSLIFQGGLREGMIINEINGMTIETMEDYSNAMKPFISLEENETIRTEIKTNTLEIVNLFNKSLVNYISVEGLAPSKIKTGLDLRGGARAFIKADVPLDDIQLNDLIAVSEQRLNVYGLSDVRFFRVTTSSQENLMGVEIAGSSPEDLEGLIAQQGKFEAKIGNNTVFVGGDEDITHVGRSGQDALITECFAVQEGEACNFKFVIFLSEDAAKRHADITGNLSLNGSYLSEQLDFYIDEVKTSSLNIGASLKGQVTTSVAISGSGSGQTRQEALEATKLEMKKLQTILITGSLPYKLEIVKIDKISPNLGEKFTRQILLAGLFAIIAVSLLIFIRYRKIKVSLALVAVSLSEVLIILGVAALVGWNLDLPSIAGIIAAIGIGIDSQLIILDEARDKQESVIQRIKKALFIITTAFATTLVAMIPLTGFLSFMGIGAASAGLLKGFAVTTIIGITVGVLISRPAFADIARQMEE